MILRTKIISITALSILLIVGISTAVFVRMQNTKMVKDKLQDTEFLCDIIERTTETAMREGKTVEVQKILENIGKNREILALRVISPDGTILKSMHTDEIGSKSGDFLKAPLTSPASLKPVMLNDTTINYFHEIPNRKECYGCHAKSNTIIGFIQVKHDISRNFATFLSIKKMLIYSNISMVVVVSLILSLLFSQLIMSPLRRLLSTIREVETGNWQATVDIRSNDELGLIGRSFNKMIEEVNNLYKKNLLKERELLKIRVDLEHKNRVEDLNDQLEFKIKELETANRAITSLSREVKNKNIELEKAVERLKKINEVGRILSSIIETRELMKIIIQTTADLLRAEKVILHLRDANKPEMTIQYQKGLGIQTLSGFSFELNPAHADLFTHGRPVFLPSADLSAQSSDTAKKFQIGVPLRMKGQVIGALLIENNPSSTAFTEEELELLTTLSNQAMVAIENAWLYESVKTNYFSTIQSLVNALEASDRFTKGHSERVRLLSLELGRFIGLDMKELELLEHASILHDIGKIGIDTFILQKQGKLTPHEYGVIKTHPLIGDEILGPIKTLEGIRRTIIQHHERYDGSGYPYGLRGDEISLKARILSVVDTFDAMMSDRPYRKALSFPTIKEELKMNAGTQFDPHVVDAFVNLLGQNGDELLSMAGYNHNIYSPFHT